MTGNALQWWELVHIDESTEIKTYAEFEKELLTYFEPVNRELNARKMLRNLKQMGKCEMVKIYNREFSKWLLQIPTMTSAEPIFNYMEGLKRHIRI